MRIKSKLLKLEHLISASLNHQKNWTYVKSSGNVSLKIVTDSILQVKNSKYSSDDEAVFSEMKKYRQFLANNNESIDYSIFNIDDIGIVHDILKRAASPEIWCKYLYLLTKNSHAKNYLEIGTNLGVSGSYILSALKNVTDSRFVTMEGTPKLCELATTQFETIASEEQFTVIQGLYKNTFPKMLEMPLHFDMSFIDGNHKFEPTLYYFTELKKKSNRPAIFIFDDIYLNSEMIKLWEVVKKDSDISFAIDLYKVGIVIIDSEEKQRNTDLKFFLAR